MDNGSARVIFTFDGDAAGQKAALRAFEDDQKFAAETYIAIAPDGMDPCDLRLAKGDEAVADLVEPRTPLFEFALRQIVVRYDLDTPAGRAAALDEAAADRRPDQEQRRPARGRRPARRHARHPGHPVRRQARRPDWPVGPATAAAGDRRPPAGRPAAVRRRPLRARRRAARPSTSATPSTPPSASCSNSPCSARNWSPRPSTRTASTSSPPPPYAAVRQAIVEAGGAEQGVQDPQEYLVRVREAAPDDTVRAMVTELAVEAIMRRTVDEAYAGDAAGHRAPPRRRAPRPRRSRAPLTRLGSAAATRRSWRRAERAVGAPAVRPGPARGAARRPSEPAPPGPRSAGPPDPGARPRPSRALRRVTDRVTDRTQKVPHAPRGGDVSYPTLGGGA